MCYKNGCPLASERPTLNLRFSAFWSLPFPLAQVLPASWSDQAHVPELASQCGGALLGSGQEELAEQAIGTFWECLLTWKRAQWPLMHLPLMMLC